MPTKTTKPIDVTQPGDFSLTDLLAGATQLVTTVTLSNDPVTAGKVEKITVQIEQLENLREMAKATDTARTNGTRKQRLSEKDETRTAIEKLITERDELLSTLEGTYLDFSSRRLTAREMDELRAQDLTPGLDLSIGHFIKSETTVRPHGAPPETGVQPDAAQWEGLINLIGEAQFRLLDREVGRLTYQNVMPDFYERYSASRPESQPSSSES